MARTDRLDMTLTDVIGRDTPTDVIHEAAQAMGLTDEQLSTTRLGSIGTSQLHALCVTLNRSADEIVGRDMGPLSMDERRLLHAWRVSDERGRRLIEATAEISQGWTEGSSLRIVEGGKA